MIEHQLKVHNSLSGEKELFTPITPGFIGMYVCGPTVYSDVHLGNVRTFVNFDLLYRYLLHLGYKIRYVRNITDVGHLLDDGEDRMSKGAKLEKLEPMEVAQKYSNGFHDMMRLFNTLSPSIEPRATGHIPEQIKMVQDIINNGYGYESNGSVYFDVMKFNADKGIYGDLSGRILDDLLTETRELHAQSDKRNPADFAIWMKAKPEHIMRWSSPWGEGFPGWHLECSAMSTKYLGEQFDIHGGGNDLKFPHHENEVAQSVGACNCAPAKYWLHTNMLLMNGRKMSKSDGNTISPYELISGESTHVSKGYAPTVVRFMMLQTHYRSTMDLTDDALLAAEKGYKRLMEAKQALDQLTTDGSGSDTDLNDLIDAQAKAAYEAMDDDFNACRALSYLFEVVPKINSMAAGTIDSNNLSAAHLEKLQRLFHDFIYDIFGLTDDGIAGSASGPVDDLMQLVIDLRADARANKDWTASDKIRDKLSEAGIQIKDSKEGSSWSYL
jgi:cysteinyl-tRNA synthetase